MTQHSDDPHQHEDDDAVDGCLCEIANDPAEMIADDDLPPATGGVSRAETSPGDDDEDVCGFQVTDATEDEHLPAAVGGVA